MRQDWLVKVLTHHTNVVYIDYIGNGKRSRPLSDREQDMNTTIADAAYATMTAADEAVNEALRECQKTSDHLMAVIRRSEGPDRDAAAAAARADNRRARAACRDASAAFHAASAAYSITEGQAAYVARYW